MSGGSDGHRDHRPNRPRAAEDSTGCVVAIDGHWFDVADVLAEPDVGLVQLHGVSSTGTEEWHHLDAGAVLGQCLDFPCIGFWS